MVSSENSHDWPYTRKLTGFVDLGKEKIEFGNNNAFGSSARIPAIYELKKIMKLTMKFVNILN